jgi:hypothetical protein
MDAVGALVSAVHNRWNDISYAPHMQALHGTA